MKERVILLVAASMVIATMVPARALVCKSKKGKLTVRTKCKKKEMPVGVDDIFGPSQVPGPPGAQGPAGPTGSSAPGPVRVLDNANKEVGVVVTQGYYGGTTVLRRIDPDWFSFDVDKKGFVTLSDDVSFFRYKAPGCTGPKFVYAGYGAASPDNLIRRLNISTDATKGYAAQPAEASVPEQLYRPYTFSSSVSGAFLSCGTDTALGAAATCDPVRECGDTAQCFCLHCCPHTSYSGVVTGVDEVDVGSLGLTPPFHLDR